MLVGFQVCDDLIPKFCPELFWQDGEEDWVVHFEATLQHHHLVFGIGVTMVCKDNGDRVLFFRYGVNEIDEVLVKGFDPDSDIFVGDECLCEREQRFTLRCVADGTDVVGEVVEEVFVVVLAVETYLVVFVIVECSLTSVSFDYFACSVCYT